MPHALVIGGGVTGLTSAWCLVDRGYEVTIIAKQYASNDFRITSQIAGALWEWPPAVCGRHTDEKSLTNSKRWCTISYKRFKDIESIADGIKFRMANFLFLSKVVDCVYQREKMREIKESCVEDFRHDVKIVNELQLNPDYGVVDAYQHLAPVIDTDRYMAWLTNFLRSHPKVKNLLVETLNGDLLQQEDILLRRFQADVIVNATGLGSEALANDSSVYPLRGALIRVLNDGSKFPKLDVAICLSLDGRPEEAADMIFMVPRNDTTLILGGLAEPHEWDLAINMENHLPLRNMYNRNVALYPPLKAAKIDPNYPIAVGLRPFRKTNVRVEREKRADTRSCIIHSYGQGGAGFSLSFGCAEDVANIADSIVKETRDQKKLPSLPSFFLILLANFLFNVSFYVIIPTATEYTKSLGGGTLFSGLVIGGVTFTSTLMLIPLSKLHIFRHRYMPALNMAASCLCIGNVFYAIADQTNFLYLVLIGRLISGFGFTGWFFVKRYCTDLQLVGIRRRTMCSSLLVVAQTLGMVIGPILGSLLERININTRLINSNTLPGWVMAATWLMYWIFEHIDEHTSQQESLTYGIVLVGIAMCFNAFIVFFELGAWESQIPLFSKKYFGWSEWNAGYFIGLVGLGSFFLMFPLSFASHKVHDRIIILIGFLIGGLGLLLHLIFISKGIISIARYGISWFLVCWGFNLSSTITLSLTSKILPNQSSDKAALAVQLSNYMGRFTGAIWGTAGSSVGDMVIVSSELGFVVIGVVTIISLWHLMLIQSKGTFVAGVVVAAMATCQADDEQGLTSMRVASGTAPGGSSTSALSSLIEISFKKATIWLPASMDKIEGQEDPYTPDVANVELGFYASGKEPPAIGHGMADFGPARAHIEGQDFAGYDGEFVLGRCSLF
ncbi:hypothetical protein L7F22_020865 [Adiantum nelumboides]|nr:hypothetical protein [Adiantum nelumboides]